MYATYTRVTPCTVASGVKMNNYFDIQARNKERAFLKKMKSGDVFKTVKGKPNFIHKITAKAVYLKTTKTRKTPICISRNQFRQAIAYLLYKRTTTRKELESFTRFNSALMGLLWLVFPIITETSRTVTGLFRITLKGLRFFFSGTSRDPKCADLIKEYGGEGTFLLHSYAHIREDSTNRWLYHANRLGFNKKILIDSGGFTLFKAKREGRYVKPITVQAYAKFLLEHLDSIYGFFSLDDVESQVQTERNNDYLRSLGLNPIPVWSVQSGFDSLEQIIQESHELIGVGGSLFVSEEERRKIFDELFKQYGCSQCFHLLGGASNIIYDYAWHSVDSTAWLNPRKCGTILTSNGYVPLPDNWTAVEGMVYSIQHLSQLEYAYSGSHQLNLLIPPTLKQPAIQQMAFSL